MNYRHEYHAGNFADVVKHAVLARVLEYMRRKPQPFRVIDTHAGAGRYDLLGTEASKTGEWRDGIGRLVAAKLPDDVTALLAPYLDAVRAINEEGALYYYPGSPLIARGLMRPDDVLVANELNAEEFARLKGALKGARSTSVLNLDAWNAIKSLLPPKERRGVVLIDPPFEERDEFEQLGAAIGQATKRFLGGVYLVWYPLKDEVAADRFVAQAVATAGLDYIDVRLRICRAFAGLGLTAAGVLVLNPPYVLGDELNRMMPAVSELLAEGEGSGFRLRGNGVQ